MSEKHLFIVFWNSHLERTRAATTVLELETDAPSLEVLERRNSGRSLRDFFCRNNISVQEAKKLFPGKEYIVPSCDIETANWDSPFTWLGIPKHPEGLRPLANHLQIPIHVRFASEKGINAIRKFKVRPRL